MDAQSKHQQQLCDAVISTLTKLYEECFRRLFESASRRIKAVIKHPVRCSETPVLLCVMSERRCVMTTSARVLTAIRKIPQIKNTEMWTKQATFKVYKTIRNIYEKKNFNIRFCFLFFSKTCHLHYPECNSLTLVVWILLCCTHRHTVCGCYKKVWSAVFTPSWCLFKWHPQSFLWS